MRPHKHGHTQCVYTVLVIPLGNTRVENGKTPLVGYRFVPHHAGTSSRTSSSAPHHAGTLSSQPLCAFRSKCALKHTCPLANPLWHVPHVKRTTSFSALLMELQLNFEHGT